MKKSDTAKIGLAAVGVGIIGYGLYSMKKDTEKLLSGPGSFLDGLFGPDGILGGSGLPGTETEPVNSGSSTKRLYEYAGELNPLSTKNLDGYYEKSAETVTDAASWTWEKYTGLLKSDPLYGTKLGISLLPGGAAAVGITRSLADKAGSLFIKETSGTPQGTNVADIKSPQQAVSMGLGLAPLAVNAQPVSGPVTKYTEKASSSSSSNSYTDSTGRAYTPTNVIKARW